MPSFTTVYRAFVMIAVGVIVVKGWQLYGPTTKQVRSFGVRAIELAQAAWNNVEQCEAEGTTSHEDPRLAAAADAAQAPPNRVMEPAPLFSAEPGAAVAAAAEVTNGDSLPATVADGLPLLYSRLEQLGASEPQLGPWGSSGQLYRFCCRAALAESPALVRHFEAVAPEPIVAVEQVVEKVEAWRSIQRGSGLR